MSNHGEASWDKASWDKAYWEARYEGGHGHGHGSASPHLAAAVGGLPTGRALEAGCGEGANAIWLATRGWEVMAVDISAAALRRARAQAAELDPAISARITWTEGDLTTMPPDGRFDLVTAHYVHPQGSFERFVDQLGERVAPGGLLLVVGHDPSDAHSSKHAPADVSVDAGELAARLDQTTWEVQVAETRRRGTGEERAPTLDAVLCARRTMGET